MRNFTFHLSSSPDVTRYQLKYWNNIPGSPFDGENHAWSPTNLSTTGHMSTLGTYTDNFTQGEGTHYFSFSACDVYGICSGFSTPFVVTYDKTAPTGLFNISPANGTFTTTANLQHITWSAATDVNGPVSYYYESSHSSAVNPNGSFVAPAYQSGALSTNEINTSGTPAGVYYWHVRAVDAAGNSTAWTPAWKVTVDNTRPNATITAPSSGSYNNTGNFTIKGTASDTLSGVSHVNIYVTKFTSTGSFGGYVVKDQPASFDPTTGTFTYNVSGLADGTYAVKADAFDKAGNNHFANTVQVTVDTVAPVVAITSPSNGAVLSYAKNGTVMVQGSVTDNNPSHYYWRITGPNNYDISKVVYDASSFTNQTITSWDLDNLPSGMYTIDLEARDAAGNKGANSVQTINVTVDNTAPVVTVTGPTSTTDTTPTITGTVDSASTTLAVTVNGHTYSATVDTTANSGGTYNWSADVTNPLTVGNYTVTVDATDMAGNTSTTTGSLAITTAPSTPTVITPSVVTSSPTNNNANGANNGNANTNTSGNNNANNAHVLGDHTTTPSNNHTITGKVKGDSTVNIKNASAKHSRFLGLGWWWLAVLAALLAIWLAATARRKAIANKDE